MIATLLISGVTVVLPMQGDARGTELTLGEIAQVRGDDPESVERVRAFGLGYSPAPGFTRLLHAHRLQEDLARAFPGLAITFAGESACRVKPLVVEVAADVLQAVAADEIARAFAGQDLSYTPRQPILPVSVPAGLAAPTLRARIDNTLPDSGVLAVPVQILIDGTPYRTVWTSWSVSRFDVLPVLDRPLKNGDRIQPFHLKTARVPAADPRAKPLPASMLVGAVAARNLEAGRPITELDVHRPAVVGLGDDVVLEVKKGAIAARVAAVSLGTAAIGDRVRVRANSNGQEHSALVVSRDLVRIDLASNP
jgi:flagella basal body P-ring formation protein FlgA